MGSSTLQAEHFAFQLPPSTAPTSHTPTPPSSYRLYGFLHLKGLLTALSRLPAAVSDAQGKHVASEFKVLVRIVLVHVVSLVRLIDDASPWPAASAFVVGRRRGRLALVRVRDGDGGAGRPLGGGEVEIERRLGCGVLRLLESEE